MAEKKTKILFRLLFAAYLCGLLYFTIFAESLGRGYGGLYSEARYNLTPFNEILRFIKYRGQLGMKAVMLNVVGNCIAFVPCGMLMAAISSGRRNSLYMVLSGFMVSFVIECTQLVFRVGSFDVDDLILNTLGTAIGVLIVRLLRQVYLWAYRKRQKE